MRPKVVEEPSPFMAYRRLGYPRLKYHPRNTGWRDRIYLRFHNDADFNSDFQECCYYDPCSIYPPETDFKYIEWCPRKKWWNQGHMARDFQTFEKYIRDGEKWIIVEPYLVGDTCGRWISVGNSFHKTAAWGAVLSMGICYLYPNRWYVYWPLTIASVGSMIGYFFFMRDPVNKYQVETDNKELARFPMKTFLLTPMVFRKTENIKRRICHRILATIGLIFSIYYLPSYPPCGCAWGAMEMVDEIPPGYWSYWTDLFN